MVLTWMKCVGDVWCKLNAVNLNHSHFDGKSGVYMVWHGGANPHVVYVGQGVFRDRLLAHRQDDRIQQFADLDLYVTWAEVEKRYRDGVEAFLAKQWSPKVGVKHPDAPQIHTNSPW